MSSKYLAQRETALAPLGSVKLESWLNWIELAQRTGRKRSWFQVASVARRMGLLQPAPRTVVVAGTNGKGTSVCFIEQLLLAQGVRVGSTYSPHLQRYNERVRVNGREVSDGEIVSAFEAIHDVQDDVQLSYHDYATLASLWIFKQHRVDFAVLEVGVGGRYDATNVVRRDVNVITTIAMDHQDMLGSDLETIAWEKVGIARCGVPLVYGDSKRVPTVIGRARVLNCPILKRGSDFEYRLPSQKQCSVSIRHGVKKLRFEVPRVPMHPLSLVLAVQVLATLGFDVSDSVLERAHTMQLPGRIELVNHRGRNWLLDVAHNPDAINYLMRFIPKLTSHGIAKVLLGTLKHKDFSGIIDALKTTPDRILVTATQGRRGTTWTGLCTEFGIQCIEDLDLAYQKLVADTVSGDLILVVGSFDVVGRLRTKVAS